MSTADSGSKRARESEGEAVVDNSATVPSNEPHEPPTKKLKVDLPPPKAAERDDDAEEDILKSGWLYIDSSGSRQGPFLTRDMQSWYQTGFIIDSLLVRRVDQTDYTPLAQHSILKQPPKPLKHNVTPHVVPSSAYSQYYNAAAYQMNPSAGFEEFLSGQTPGDQYHGSSEPDVPGSYSQKVFFTQLGGRFKAQDPNAYWESKGLATDKAGRQMSSFFDVDKYQDEMNIKKAEEKKKPVKLTRKQIEDFKQKKIQKRVKKLLED